MEKRKPAYDLAVFQAAASTRKGVLMTTTALTTASGLGFGRMGIVGVLKSMKREQFVKSMTAYADSSLWQDVYHVPSEAGVLYVKFCAGTVTEFVLLSFKEIYDG